MTGLQPTAANVLKAIMSYLDISRTWDEAAAFGGRITNPLDHYSRTSPLISSLASAETPRLGFENYLSSVTANPSDPIRTELIRKYFVFPTAPNASHDAVPSVNATPARLEQAVKSWIANARRFADAFASGRQMPKQEPNDIARQAIVSGDRGVGKTFLQNFVVSEYSPVFDAAKVLWVRISLVREVDSSWDMNHWVKAQITKILCRYYDPKSEVFRKDPASPMVVDMDQVFARTRHEASGPQRGRLETMLRILRLRTLAADKDIGPDWIPLDFADVVFNDAVMRGVGFIIVFDGLDLLGNTRALKSLFHDRLEAVAKYICSDAPLWRYHLLFIREESAWAVQGRIRDRLQRGAEQVRPITDYRVAPVDLESVLNRRLSVLEEDVTVNRLGGYAKDDVRAFRTFLENTQSGLVGENTLPLTYATVLRQVLGTNTRSAMQVLHAAAYEYIQGQSRTHYLLTDRLMRLGQPLPPASPTYRHMLDDGVSRLERQHGGGGQAVYDATFLPSVFRFPFDHNASAANELRGEAKAQLLMGLRLLQLAKVLERHEGVLEVLDEESVVGHVSELFEYESLPVRAMLEELVDEEVMQPAPQTKPYSVADPGLRQLRVTPKGRQILDRYVFDPAYLNVAAFTLPVPASLLQRSRPWFTVVPLRSDTDTAEIVFGKILNSLTLARLICDCSEAQNRSVNTRRRSLSSKTSQLLTFAEREVTPAHGGIFTFEERLRNGVVDVGERIMSSLEKGRYVKILGQFSRLGVKLDQ